jgi:hypothetical protein
MYCRSYRHERVIGFFEEAFLCDVKRSRPQWQDSCQIKDAGQLEVGMVVEKVGKDGSIERMSILAVGQAIKLSEEIPVLVDDPPNNYGFVRVP